MGEALDEMLNKSDVNTTNSSVKTKIENWYNTNLSSYTNYIEDTIYCNDRRIGEINGWNPNGGSTASVLYFSPYTRTSNTQVPNIECGRTLDSFTVSSSSGNGALTYPVGLITSDEVMYAGGKYSTSNTSYYLYTNQEYWTLSPDSYEKNSSFEIVVFSGGAISHSEVDNEGGIRPVISLKSTDIVDSGDGTSTNPYVIRTS